MSKQRFQRASNVLVTQVRAMEALLTHWPWNQGVSKAKHKKASKTHKIRRTRRAEIEVCVSLACAFANRGMCFIHTSITRETSTYYFGFFSVIYRPLSRQSSDTEQGEHWVDHQVALVSNSDTLYTPTPNMLQNSSDRETSTRMSSLAKSILLEESCEETKYMNTE
jgi:hypothetical protein